jgi:death on curing protein
VIFLNLEELLHVAARTLGADPEVRDAGLLESALARPRASAFGDAAYPTSHLGAAALLHSLARDHALDDGNKRLAPAGIIAFYGINGMRLTLTNDRAYELVVDVASGAPNEVPQIASVLEASTERR